MRVDETRLLMLGGSANPRGKVEYNIASDTWTPLQDLPFSFQNGACLTTEMPGNLWLWYNRARRAVSYLIHPQMTALSMEGVMGQPPPTTLYQM